jgi:hypothetical protein
LSSSGSVPLQGSLSAVLEDAILSSNGTAPIVADLSASLGNASLSSNATLQVDQISYLYSGIMVDPRGLSVIEWADYTTTNLEAFGVVGRLDREDDWRTWAQNVASLAEMQRRTVPPPYMYSDWRDWAVEFNRQFDKGL